MLGICLWLWLALLGAGNTPVGRGMRHCLVEWPAARLSRIQRGAVLVWLVLVAIGAACFWLLEEEGLRMFAMALPELTGWMTAFEIGSLVDAIAIAVLAASTVRIGAVKAWVMRRLPIRRARARRARRTRPVRRGANDDEDGAITALTA
jgi:hypothetical protein